MSISGINFSGLGSGLDDSSIIQQLISVDSQPMKLLQQQQQTVQTKQQDIGQVSALVTALQSSASTLNSSLGFSPVTATSNDTTVATVSAVAGAQTGSVKWHFYPAKFGEPLVQIGNNLHSSRLCPFCGGARHWLTTFLR